MKELNALPKYIWYDDDRYFLTLSTDIQGQWQIGYAAGNMYPLEYALGPFPSIHEAVESLKDALEKEKA